MSDENNSVDNGTESSSPFSPAEEAFFASGGESEIPADSADTVVVEKPADKPADGDVAGVKTPPDRLLAAVHEERGKRKALEKETREMREKLANFEGKFAVLDRLAPKDESAKPAGPPTAEEDIFGKVKHTDETVAQLQKRLDDNEAANKAAGEQTAFISNYRGDAAAFEAKTPDFKAGYDFLLNTRAAELIAIGFDDPKVLQDAGADPAEVQAAAKALHDALVADEYAIAERAFKSKKSPAEIIYNLAKQRGYKIEAKAADTKPGEQTLDLIERGQQAHKTLNGGGGPGSDDMTAEKLLAMPMDEYEGWVTKHPAKARAIMGG